MLSNEESPHQVSRDFLERRIEFLEEQLRSTRASMKYQRYSLLERGNIAYDNKDLLGLLYKLVPYKCRSPQKIYALAYSKFSWQRLLWRHPFKFKIWMTAKKLQRGIKRN